MRVRTVAILIAAAALVLGSASTSLAAGWSAPTKLFRGMEGPVYSTTFDGAGHVHAAVQGDENPGLFYVTESGHVRVVGGSHVEFESAVAYGHVSGHAVVRIVWVDTSDRTAIWLTRNDTGTWVSSRLWLGKAFTPSVATLGNGIAVAFQDAQHRLRYLKWTPTGGPTSPVVVSSQCCTGDPSLAMHDGLPSIAFSEANTGGGAHELRLARRDSSGAWHVTTVDTHGTSAPSLAFSAAGQPVIAYNGPSGVWYANKSGAWHLHHLLNAQNSQPAIAADSTGEVALVAIHQNPSSMASHVLFERVDVSSAPQTVATDSQLLGTPGDPRIGLAGGRATVTYTSSCGCTGPGFLWVSKQN